MPRAVVPEAAAGDFASRLIAWQRASGRHDLPWQQDRSAYRVWVSEIMLQQTQVATVIPYFHRFIDEFSDVASLADAPIDRVMQHWAGLGYYSRARNLHRCAIEVVARHGGAFPDTAEALESLPGIGRSTAAAILALAFGKRAAILDGNVKRVLCRRFGVGGVPDQPKVQAGLWQLAQQLAPSQDIGPYTQGLMDLGATVCTRTRPDCARCPVRAGCVALREDRVALLPERRAAKAVPDRHALLLLVERGDDVLLLKLPPSGIWGGLWSLPQLQLDAADLDGPRRALHDRARQWLRAQGLQAASVKSLAPIEHRFTHFRLRALPLQIVSRAAVDGSAQQALAEPAAIWMERSELPRAALPAPIKTLLAGTARRPPPARRR